MSLDKMVTLLTTLIQRTDNGEVGWEETAGNDTYQVAFPDYTVRVAREDIENQYGDIVGENFTLGIYSDKGKLIDQVDVNDLRNVLPDPHSTLKELYSSARRNALGADKALDEILSSLSEKGERSK